MSANPDQDPHRRNRLLAALRPRDYALLEPHLQIVPIGEGEFLHFALCLHAPLLRFSLHFVDQPRLVVEFLLKLGGPHALVVAGRHVACAKLPT